MKKIIILFSVFVLCSCANPEIAMPFGRNGPTYYKVHECYTVRDFPQSYKSWDPVRGRYDTYITNERTTHIECNYNIYTYSQSLNNVYLYGGSY